MSNCTLLGGGRSSIGCKDAPYGFHPFVTFIKDDNNHDNLIIKHRSSARARYKETINKCGWDSWMQSGGRVGP